jgi:hypothetical protein
MTLLCCIVEVRSCLTSVLGFLQFMAISSVCEAAELYGVLIGGVDRLPTDAPPSEPAEGKE